MAQEHFLSIVKWIDVNGNGITSTFFSKGRDEEEAQNRADRMFRSHCKKLYGKDCFEQDELFGTSEIEVISFVTDVVRSGHVFDISRK